MSIIELTPRVAVIPGGVNTGVLRGDAGRCVLIDAGLNETSAKKALNAVRAELGGDVVAIITTHGHADHFGANAAVVKRTGAEVWAPAFDEAFLRYPLLQPACLFAGADPPTSMRGGFLLAAPSPVDHVIVSDSISLEGFEIEVVPLAGHSPNQNGFLVEGQFFSADVVLPESVLQKYKIPYLFSVRDHITALETARNVQCTTVVPGHGPLMESIEPLVTMNGTVVREVIDAVLGFCAEPRTAEAVLAQILALFGADPTDAPSYYLLQPTVFSCLAYLLDEGLLTHDVSSGCSRWQVR